MNTLLRTMTVKSIIGFGQYKSLTVQDLLNLQLYKELLSMYYQLEKINFTPDILEALHITGDRVIDKPGKNTSYYKDNIYNMICELNNKTDFKHILGGIMHQRKMDRIKRAKQHNHEHSKLANMIRNRRGY